MSGRRRARRQTPPRRVALPTQPAVVLQPPLVAPTEVEPVNEYPRQLTTDELTGGKDDTQLTAELAAALRKIPVCNHCVVPGAYVSQPVPMPIEEIGAGAQVYGSDGHLHEVVSATTHRYNGVVLTINARGTLPATVTPDHEFAVFPQLWTSKARCGWKWRQARAPENEQPVWRRADELKVGDYVVSPIPEFTGVSVPERWASDDAMWLLGLLAGDGHTAGRDGKKYHLGLVLSREADIERARVALERMHSYVRVARFERYTRLHVSCRDLAEDVAALIGSGSSAKHLPDFVWSSKDTLRQAFDGLMAADGTVMERGPKGIVNRLFTTSPVLARQGWQAALMLGNRPYLRAVNRTSGYPNAKPAWTVEWSHGSAAWTAVQAGFYVMPITKIQGDDYDGPVHDLTVADDHTFTTNGILTHNCGGRHARACPRVRRMEFHPNGSLASVEFWAEGKWNDSEIIWQEDLIDED